MNEALGWIGAIIDWLGQFIPRRVVYNTAEGAVKFQTIRIRDLLKFKWEPSAKPVLLAPGLHFYWPIVTELKGWVVARQSVNLPTQTITTKDGKTIAVGGVLIFRILDPYKLITDGYNPDEIVRDISSGVLHQVFSESTWDELRMAVADGGIAKVLKAETRRRLRPWGVKVIMAVLTDFSQTRVLKLIQSTHSDMH